MRTPSFLAGLLLALTGGASGHSAHAARTPEPPFQANLKERAEENSDFRRVLFTGPNVQVVLMSLRAGEDIGEETHDVDQCFFFVDGSGESVIAGKTAPIEKDEVMCVPAGTRHNIRSGKGGPLKLYTFYAPPEHPPGTIHHTKADAERAEPKHEH